MRLTLRTWIMGVALLVAALLTISGCGETPTPLATGIPADTPSPTATSAPTETPAPVDTPAPTDTSAPTDTPASTSVSPTVVLAPTSGSPGTTVQVTAAGFQPDTSVQVGIGRENSEYDVIAMAEADADGRLTMETAIPEFAEPGERWVVVADVPGQPVTAVSNLFEVTASEETAILITPRMGPIGTEVLVTAEGFPPNAPVEIGFGRVDSEYDVITTAQADAEGEVTAGFEIPGFADPDDAWVVVVATEDHNVRAVSDPFDVVASVVTPAPSPTAGSGLFTRASIYLIAVGDAGQSGELIGCDDSAVPVEVEIEPTIAPLTAALERLFAFDPEAEGYPELYNVFQQSDLTVDGINIVAGEATIALSGELVLGGVCDNPRVEAQLERTALQYSTVDQVSITLNGEPLEDVLSLQ